MIVSSYVLTIKLSFQTFFKFNLNIIVFPDMIIIKMINWICLLFNYNFSYYWILIGMPNITFRYILNCSRIKEMMKRTYYKMQLLFNETNSILQIDKISFLNACIPFISNSNNTAGYGSFPLHPLEVCLWLSLHYADLRHQNEQFPPWRAPPLLSDKRRQTSTGRKV